MSGRRAERPAGPPTRADLAAAGHAGEAEGFRDRLRDVSLHEAMLLWVLIGPEGAVLEAGPEFAELLGTDVDGLRGAAVETLLCAGDAARTRDVLADRRLDPADRQGLLNVQDDAGRRFSLRARIERCAEGLLMVGALQTGDSRALQDQLHELTGELAVLARRNRRQAKELRKALEERERSYWHLQKIQEVLPLCMDCGTVNPGSDWMPLVDYLKLNSIDFSHGVCSGCLDKRLADLGQT